jgi:hypothetical protein
MKNDKELTRLRTRIKEEFLLIQELQGRADIESAMINIDNLIEYLLEQSDNSDYTKCSEDLFELQSKYDGLLPKKTIVRILKKHFA